MTLDRLDFYNRLWEIGIVKFAKELELTHSELRKICDAFDIPVPSGKYWAALHYGKVKPERTSLPPFKGCQVIEFKTEPKKKAPEHSSDSKATVEPLLLKAGTIPVNEAKIEKAEHVRRKKALKLAETGALKLNLKAEMGDWEDKIDKAVTAYPINTILHPKKAIILDSLEYYNEEFKPWRERNTGRYFVSRDKQHLALYVSKEMLRPALAVYDSILDIAAALGLTVNVKNNLTEISIDDYKVEISVREINRKATVREEGSNHTRTELRGTGKLKICMGSSYRLKEYKETDFINIQQRLDSFFRGLMISYTTQLEWRREREHAELLRRQYEEQKRLEEVERQRLEKLKENEREMVIDMVVRASKFRIFQSLQAYAAESRLRGLEDMHSEIIRVADMFNPWSPEYGGHLEEDDILDIVKMFVLPEE